MSQAVLPGGTVGIGYRKATVSSTARALSWTSFTDGSNTGIPSGAEFATVYVEGTAGTNDVRWRIDGGVPTSSAGHLCLAGGSIQIAGADNIAAFQLIVTGSDAAVTVDYEKAGFNFG